VAGGAGGAIIATRDGGQTWTPQTSGTVQAIMGIAFTDLQNGWAVDLYGNVRVTNDGGQSWRLSDSIRYALLGVDSAGAQGCCAVGEAGAIALTDNAGANWTLDNAGTASNLNGVDFVDATHGWIVGDGGLILSFQPSRPRWVPVPGERGTAPPAAAGSGLGRTWTNKAAIDPMALLLPGSIYTKWVEAHHPHTPEQLRRFLTALRPAEVQVIRARAAELRDLAAEVEQVASKIKQPKR
jgi:hypothetical protein